MKTMNNRQTCFTSFKHDIKNHDLPERFTFPFCYKPHPLCLLAAQELQQQLSDNTNYQQEFSHTGKMFGVLLVENFQGEVGYLSAFSGKLNLTENIISFVPSVFNVEEETTLCVKEVNIINSLNSELDTLLANPLLDKYQQALELKFTQQDKQFELHRNKMAWNKKIRKEKRVQARDALDGGDLAQRLKQLAQESIDDKNQLRDLKTYWREEISQVQQKLDSLTDEINVIKKRRKQLSTRLQTKIFKQYKMLNSEGVEKDLIELFKTAPFQVPPAGTGDCAAPKLLQYAFKQKLKPLGIAEFWWGQAPKSEIRQHKNFYPACSGKCQPVLAHMLEGMTVDDNPLLVNPAEGKLLEIIYQDDDIVVVNKPSEFLSVPGKHIEDSVYLRIKQQFPQATGSYIVHRLDMSTSGVMVLSLTKRAQKHIQQQFVNRTIKKRYIAILEGDIEKKLGKKHGEINLPLRGDFDDKPKQLVCFEQGKKSKTQWEVIDVVAGKSKLYLYPESGRTHQLRVHCAHPLGLNLPILGDDLYGINHQKNGTDHNDYQRLHLHAEMLTLTHPITKEVMTFQIKATF
jgi:tRNA pseudouridine32 synthase/23S rRNA pseudouridine746 synthase